MARPCCSNTTTACACKADGTGISGDGTSLNPFSLSTAANDAAAACGCTVDGTTITGTGTTEDPFISAATGAVVDGTTITGAGTTADPFVAVTGGTAQPYTVCDHSTFTNTFAECAAANLRGCVYQDPTSNILFTRPAAGCIKIDSRDNPPNVGNDPEFLGMGPSVTIDNSGPDNAFNNTAHSLHTLSYTNDSCLPAQVQVQANGWYGRYRLLNDTPVTAGLFTGVQGRTRLAVNTVIIDDHQSWEIRDEDLNGKTGESVSHAQGGSYTYTVTLQQADVLQFDVWCQVFTDERTQGLVAISGKASLFINQCNDGRL